MKTVSPGLQAHLDTGATTMCYCWRITRTDGLVQGFTEHDEDLTFDGTTFLAKTGFTASQVQQTLGLSVDNMNVDGAVSSETINEDDLAAGKYDDAYIELFWVNWQDPSQRLISQVGYTGEAKRTGAAFSAELRGLTSRLGQTTIRTFQRTCDAQLGDSRCKIDLTSSTYKGSGTITEALGPRTHKASGLGGYDTDWFSQGVLTFTSGENDGVKIDVKEHVKDGSGNVVIELWYPPAFNLEAGWTFTITAGCKLTADICNAKFGNILNFQGFAKMPGNDFVLRNVDPAASNTGSSTTTTSSSKG